MKGTVNIEFLGYGKGDTNYSSIERGKLKLPKGITSESDIIAFGENEKYIHCITSDGNYMGIYKSNDENHIYQQILKLNG